MHWYSDRLAVIGAEGSDGATERAARELDLWDRPGSRDGSDGAPDRLAPALLVTSLLPSAGKILLNADLGDRGVLGETSCRCPLGEAGFHTTVSSVRSSQRLTVDGMSLLLSELEEVIGLLVARAGGSPSHFQVQQRAGAHGQSVLVIALDPGLPIASEGAFLEDLLGLLRRRGGGWRLAAETWAQTGALQLARITPSVSAGFKQSALLAERLS
jgi:hypothetical protein